MCACVCQSVYQSIHMLACMPYDDLYILLNLYYPSLDICLCLFQWRSQGGAKGGTRLPNLSQEDPPDLPKSGEFFFWGGGGVRKLTDLDTSPGPPRSVWSNTAPLTLQLYHRFTKSTTCRAIWFTESQ